MKKFLLLASMLALLTATGLSQQKAGLLLTTASSVGDAQEFHGYWIVRDGSSVDVTTGDRLLVPRKSGWWELGITQLTRVGSQTRSARVWAAPFGQPRAKTHVMPMSDDDTCPDDMNTYTVSWVGTDFAALQHDYESSCMGRSVSRGQSFVVRLDDLREKNDVNAQRLKISELAGEDARKAMGDGAAAVSSDDENEISADEESWIVSRERGHYRLLGTVERDMESGGQTYDVPLDPPKTLVGPDALAVGWDAVLHKVPDAVDAYTSPAGDWLVIVTPHSLQVFTLDQGKIGERLKRVQIESPAVVAAQWALGEDLNAWGEVVKGAWTDGN
ncbi:MAG TPA: hypothetical protein VGL89_00200 [Candidatus Koribacter sp.]|jgi:hypothetical protein